MLHCSLDVGVRQLAHHLDYFMWMPPPSSPKKVGLRRQTRCPLRLGEGPPKQNARFSELVGLELGPFQK